jgi:SAM-dependent methyltransferase
MTTAKFPVNGWEMKNRRTPDNFAEAWRPLPHVPPDHFIHAFLFRMRLFFDLEVGTVYRDLKKAFKETAGKVLEIGCGLQPYRHLLPEQAEYYALDWEKADIHFGYRAKDVLYYDGIRFPFKEGIFNLVFHTEVLEHVYHLEPFLSECCRVLANDGQMLFTVPFAARNHYIPYDYWRLTPASITRLLQETHFTDIVVVPRGCDITVAIHKINSVCYRLIFRNIRHGILRMVNRVFFTLLFAVPIVLLTLIGNFLILMKIGSPDDPIGYTVYCKKNVSSGRCVNGLDPTPSVV